ncbi:polysaccharide deacetylase family protein [Bacillus sp. FJAT-27251]|uniref:polysaccharide deacetylase family protein n=1 Tax=Bacillus sp. FJAT-27251 TaxID=1684142 RepID=UPI0006A7EBD0|nr:polysaccharide deacetylase family protein [Bacillus sp. FJAT-27251]
MKKFILLTAFLIGAWFLASNSFTHKYLSHLKTNSAAVSVHENPLYREIETKAPQYEVKPEDAKIDPVWKAIPGYNGLKVDVAKSYSKMKKDGEFSRELLVFEEVSPKVHLSDLPPAAIYKGHPEKPMVSFIINVAWGNEYLSDMLAILKRHHVKADFFLEGRWVKNNPDLAKMIADAGHDVGNHSFTHPDMKSLSPAKINEEIAKTNDVIEATTGKMPKWFAPPSGSYKEEVVKIAAAHRLGTVMWSVDTIDWQKPSPEVLISRVNGKLHNGAMILMHPTDSTAKALDRLITEIKARNLEIGTVTEMLSEKRILKN